MRYALILLISTFSSLSLVSQDKTIINDGLCGYSYSFEDDTLRILKVIEGLPASNAGLEVNDKVISVNGIMVSGVGLLRSDLDDIISLSGLQSIDFTVIRGDSIVPLRIITETDLKLESFCRYDYLIDTTQNWGINDILSDSIQNYFSSPLDKKITISRIDAGTYAEDIGLMEGDRLESLKDNFNTYWSQLEMGGLNKIDSLLRVIRGDSILEFNLDLKNIDKLGVWTQLGYDLNRSRRLWLRVIYIPRITEDRAYLMQFHAAYDSVTMYFRNKSGKFEIKRTGKKVSGNDRDFIYKGYPSIRLNINQGKEDTIYLNIVNGNKFIFQPTITFQPIEQLLKYDRTERFITGIMLGMIIIISLYYALMFFFIKDRSYLAYSLFVFFLGIALLYDSGYGAELFWPSLTSLIDRLDVLILDLPFFLFLVFGLLYLELKRHLKTWYRIVSSLVLFLSTIAVLIVISMYFGEEFLFYGNFLWTINGISLLLSAVILIIPSILRIRQNFYPARYFLVGNILLIGLAAFYSIFVADIFSSDLSKLFSRVSIYIGVILQFLLFSAGLGKKMIDTERAIRKTKDKLIKQLERNEKLKDKVNRELEMKVQERTKEIEEQKQELQVHQKEITDSINYAKRIQTAVLPPEELLGEILPEHFVLFKPRDIVSGDFYWVKQIKNFTIVVAADCTGHGVPAGFMSMLGMSFLNELVTKSRFDSAGELLNRLRKKVKDTLKQEGKSMEQKDGMDLALAIIDNESLEMQYSGAFNPIIIIRKGKMPGKDLEANYRVLQEGDYTMIEIKGDRQPIAIHYAEKDFQTNYFQLLKNDSIYLFSDGYPDQMGGPKGKKFMAKKFKNLIFKIQDYSMAKQKEVLDETIEKWKGSHEQIDDIIVFGIRW